MNRSLCDERTETYGVLGQPIERVLVRYLRDRQKSSNLSPIFSRSRPFQIYLAFEDGDNPGEIVSAMFSTRNLLLVTDVLSTYIITHFDFRCFTSTSPSNSDTFETEMTSSPSPLIVMVTNSRSNHSLAHGVMFFSFQCQLAVDAGIVVVISTRI